MSVRQILICIFFVFSKTICAEESSEYLPIVETTHGKIAGKVLRTLIKDKEYYGFMGIPYAAPPVNDLRFLPPQSLAPWNGVLQTTKEKNPCIQFNNNVRKGQQLGHYGSEDCLYLDVFSPAPDDRQRPLIIFLFNEQLKYSHNKTKDYAPDFFIEHDVVIATISYRLSVFGFLSFEDEVLSGNSGLRDIVAGLEWIKKNAKRFGGDPNRITLMGAQGGAVAVDLLIHTKARKLFNAAILQGGSAFLSMYLQENIRDRSFKLAELLEKGASSSKQILKELSEISPQALLAYELQASPDDYSREHQRGVLTFGPIVEKDSSGLIKDYPENANKIDLSVMIGFNSREGIEKSLQYLIEPNFVGALEKDFILLMPRRVNFKFDPVDSTYTEAIKEVKNFYFTNGKVSNKNIPEYVTYMGDLMTASIDYTAKFYSNISSSELYYYYFDYYSDLNENKNDLMRLSKVEDGTWGAASGDELCYLFKCPGLKNKYLKHYKEKSEEMGIQKKMLKLWINFAKRGNPTPASDSTLDVKWPPYNFQTKEYLHIGKHIEVRKDLHKFKFGFWDNFIRKWTERAVGGIVSSKNTKDEL